MKKILISLYLFFLVLIINLCILPLLTDLQHICFGQQGSNLISIIKPFAVNTEDKYQIVEGKVEESFIKRLRLTVEPFLPKKGEKHKSLIIGVKKGYFREKITLFPGLNIISVSTLSSKHKESKAIFLISPKKDIQSQIPLEKWGTNSPVVFTSPQKLKVTAPDVLISGVITKPTVKLIKVIVINTMDFLINKSLPSQKERIDYKEVPIKNLQFSFSVKLTEGLNIIIARPSLLPEDSIDPTAIQIKTLIYEKVSQKVLLNDPEMKDGILIIKGKVVNLTVKKVKITVSALVKEEIQPERIYPKTLINKNVKVSNTGDFILKAPLSKKGLYTIKSPPTISVWANGNAATKTLLNW